MKLLETESETRALRDGGSLTIRTTAADGFAVEGRYPRDIKFGDGSYADTVAMGLPVKERPAASMV